MAPRKQTTKKKVDKKNQELVSPAESQDDSVCDAILITRSEIGEEEQMKQNAKDSLEQALDEEEFYVEEVRDHLFVGNRRGLDLAGLSMRVLALEDENTSHKTKISSLEDRATSHMIKIRSLEDRVRSLTVSLDSYKLLRNRFISTFKRDKLVNATEADRRTITEGNGRAHGGDAIVDAELYQGMAGRRDFQVFKKLYGMDPSIVLRITHQETISVLNTHATVIASNYKTGSDRFYTLFAEFVRLFEQSDYDEGFLDEPARDVTLAYWEFLRCIGHEVTRVEAAEPSD